MRLLFWVQHLLGVGHLSRAAGLARALSDAGIRTTLVSGGMPVPDTDTGTARFVQLPPTRAVDVHFKVLVDGDGHPIDDAWRTERRNRLLAAYEAAGPDVVVTELFPFGRRQLRFELEPLLARARADGCRIVSSVRDILVEPDKPSRIDEMLERVGRLYDLVLVHGDPGLIPFDTTFPRLAGIADRVRYTGYVVEPPVAAPPSGEVVVSAGGGAVGEPLLRAALAAKPSEPRPRPVLAVSGRARAAGRHPCGYRGLGRSGLSGRKGPPGFPRTARRRPPLDLPRRLQHGA